MKKFDPFWWVWIWAPCMILWAVFYLLGFNLLSALFATVGLIGSVGGLVTSIKKLRD